MAPTGPRARCGRGLCTTRFSTQPQPPRLAASGVIERSGLRWVAGRSCVRSSRSTVASAERGSRRSLASSRASTRDDCAAVVGWAACAFAAVNPAARRAGRTIRRQSRSALGGPAADECDRERALPPAYECSHVRSRGAAGVPRLKRPRQHRCRSVPGLAARFIPAKRSTTSDLETLTEPTPRRRARGCIGPKHARMSRCAQARLHCGASSAASA